MAQLVRKLEKKIWLDRQIAAEFGGLQADALKNFRTSDNTLSVFLVDTDLVPADRIVAAVAGGGQHLTAIDYAVFDTAVIDEIGIATARNQGNTPDEEVNSQHLDLVSLTADQVVTLARSVQDHGEMRRINRKDIASLLEKGISDGKLKPQKLNQELFAKLRPSFT